MQRPHRYPRRIRQPPTYWHARAGATATAAPLSRNHHARARTIRMREVFLTVCHGSAPLYQVLDACLRAGLLDELSDSSAVEIVRRALRPICTDTFVETALYQAQISTQSTRG